MAERIPTGDHFIEADVIRWKEAVFKPRRKKGRAVKLGDRVVVAEVLRQDREWVYLLVRHCELVSVTTGRLDRQVPLLQKGQQVPRHAGSPQGGKNMKEASCICEALQPQFRRLTSLRCTIIYAPARFLAG